MSSILTPLSNTTAKSTISNATNVVLPLLLPGSPTSLTSSFIQTLTSLLASFFTSILYLFGAWALIAFLIRLFLHRRRGAAGGRIPGAYEEPQTPSTDPDVHHTYSVGSRESAQTTPSESRFRRASSGEIMPVAGHSSAREIEGERPVTRRGLGEGGEKEKEKLPILVGKMEKKDGEGEPVLEPKKESRREKKEGKKLGLGSGEKLKKKVEFEEFAEEKINAQKEEPKEIVAKGKTAKTEATKFKLHHEKKGDERKVDKVEEKVEEKTQSLVKKGVKEETKRIVEEAKED